jgi:hypothetical protein
MIGMNISYEGNEQRPALFFDDVQGLEMHELKLSNYACVKYSYGEELENYAKDILFCGSE